MKYSCANAWLVIASAVVITAAPARAEIHAALGKLVSGKGNDQLDAAVVITSNRDEVIQSLLQIAETSNVKTGSAYLAKQLAIDCLGDYRAERAVDFLISEIEFNEAIPRKRAVADPDPKSGLPCLRSLIQIGRPAIDGIFKRLVRPSTTRELALFGFIIHEIDGQEVGLYRLQVALGKADGIQKEQIQRTIEIYRNEGWAKREYLSD